MREKPIPGRPLPHPSARPDTQAPAQAGLEVRRQKKYQRVLYCGLAERRATAAEATANGSPSPSGNSCCSARPLS